MLILAMTLAATQGWQIWAPRPEIAPAHETAAAGDLVLRGAGNPAVFGGWEKSFGNARPGRWYRLTARYRAQGLEHERQQVVARLDWTASNGNRAGQPDYAWRVETAGQDRLVTAEAPAPEGAAAVKVQLLLVNAPKAVVRWSAVEFKAINAPEPRPVRLAAIRLRPKGPDPVARFIDLIRSQVPPATDVILLPEGITQVGTGRKYFDVAESLPGETTRRLGELARERKAWIVAGLYEREGPVIYNTAVLINRQGILAGKYRKVYLPREEFEGGITPGDSYPVFQTDFGKVGMMICWDVQYADPARGLAARGAELLLMPIWGGNQTLAQARAIENHVFLATSGYDFPAAVYDPTGDRLGHSEADGTVVLVKIDLSRRYVDPWLGDMRGRFHKELRADVKVID